MPVRLLSNNLVNQIAAGEVIERPAAAVRELVENALDAGATQVDVMIRDGGLNFIQVADNGSGMNRDDLVLAVERHATSKLADENLFEIKTMGFRGEALPSIGAVSRLTLTTRHADDAHGWSLFIEGGAKSELQPASRGVGTTIDVRDLFYATPARLKFMKSPLSERMAIIDVMEKLALSYPAVGFSLLQEGRSLMALPPGQDFSARAKTLLKNDSDVIDVQLQENDYALHGIFGAPNLTAANAMQQYFIVNGRPIRDRQLSGVLRAAYMDVLPRNRYPVAFLHFNLPLASVDMNVHPAKAEIRFRDLARVKSLIMRGVRQVLTTPLQNNPPPRFDRSNTNTHAVLSFNAQRPGTASPGFAETWQPGTKRDDYDEVQHLVLSEEQKTFEQFPLGTARAQVFNTYIIAETADGMILVDQHAAHERIVYERMKKALQDKTIEQQGLLIPDIINVTANEQELLLHAADALRALGLELEAFGPGAVAVQSVPALLGANANLQALIRDILSIVKDEQDPAQLLERRLFDLCASFACYGSVRAGRSLNNAEMNALLRQIEETESGGQCNHGRPTTIALSRSDLEKLFARR